MNRVMFLLVSVCVPATLWILCPAAGLLVAERTGQLLDMTYRFDETTIYWPTDNPFKHKLVKWEMLPAGYWYASAEYGASEHGGTHVDAPIHFSRTGRTVEQVPLSEWIAPAVKIDVVERCEKDRDYLLTVDDLVRWEKRHGRIPDRAWVLMYTGLDTRHYPRREAVLGTTRTGPDAVRSLSFPGFSRESAEFLIQKRNITGVGLDTPSIDFGKSKEFWVHRVILGANKLAIENVAHLDKLPVKGATLHVIPMLITKGTGAPARVFATW